MRRWGWACVLGLMLAGCKEDKAPETPDAGPVETGPAALTEKEPNDRPEQALDITRNSTVSAELTAQPNKADEDWYRLAPGAPRIAEVSVSGLPGGDITLEVYDRDRNRLVGVNSEGEGKPERFPNLSVEDERFIRVVPTRKGVGGAYTLEVRMRAPEDGEEREPNDRAVDAVNLPLGQTVTAFLGHAGDEDWYRIELPDPTQPSNAGDAAPSQGGTPETPSPFGDSPSQGTPPQGAGAAPQGMGGPQPGTGGTAFPSGQDTAEGGEFGARQGAGSPDARQDLGGTGFDAEEGAAPRNPEGEGTTGIAAQQARGTASDVTRPRPPHPGRHLRWERAAARGQRRGGAAIARALDAALRQCPPSRPRWR
ncbi:hypothetical protein ACLEPN_07340 [Myxococcus sp. 1LA]